MKAPTESELASLYGEVGIEERLDRGGQALGVSGQLEVAAAVDVQLAARYQPVHDPRV